MRNRKITRYGNTYCIKLEPTDINDLQLEIGTFVDIDKLFEVQNEN